MIKLFKNHKHKCLNLFNKLLLVNTSNSTILVQDVLSPFVLPSRSFSESSTRISSGLSPIWELTESERYKLRPARGIHVFHCEDRLGIIAQISDLIAERGANLLNVDLHINLEASEPMFYSRSEFAFDPNSWNRQTMQNDFDLIGKKLNASKSFVKVFGIDPNFKMAILSSWQDHCLVDILYRWQEKQLPVEITCVISNHDRPENSHVRRFLQRHQIPYHFFPTSKSNKREEDILNIVKDSDFLILARYMQVLSPFFLKEYKKDIINIHHGLLPSFKGANPYSQAYKAGVKLIGATSHFVTEELDDGPIIEQMVEKVSHKDTLSDYATKSQNLEKQCLARAIKFYCESRIMRFGKNKTIVF